MALEKDVNDFVPCILCEGDGTIYVGERDPIEGNKMRSLAECPLCHGAKGYRRGTAAGEALQAYIDTYNRVSDELAKKRRAELLRKECIRKEALAKLTDEEKEALGIND